MPDGWPAQPVNTNRAKETRTMMNDLNSVLIEGIATDLLYQNDTFQFTLVSTRFEKKSKYHIICVSKLAENMNADLQEGRKCRVIGRLDSEEERVHIKAENVELKPRFKV